MPNDYYSEQKHLPTYFDNIKLKEETCPRISIVQFDDWPDDGTNSWKFQDIPENIYDDLIAPLGSHIGKRKKRETENKKFQKPKFMVPNGSTRKVSKIFFLTFLSYC